jgi:oxygen-independent coproporphyrinogen-3 oxidase
VHLPFCVTKCHYCDFFSVAAEGRDRDPLIRAILREAELRAPKRPRTVFFGGGTPSLLSPSELTTLLDGLQAVTGFRDSAVEITAECNPESLDLEKATSLRDLGVNRLSIGFQSLHDEVLSFFGRVHTAEDSFRAFEAARAAGFEAVSVDMIYAIPDQTAEAWRDDLGRVLDLGPDHLSAYNLTFEEGTPFRRWLEEGTVTKVHEELELELFDLTRSLTSEAGLDSYEISNYSSKDQHCLHNVNYWLNGPYVGLGPSAASKTGFTRTGNVRSVGGYQRAVETTGSAADWFETPSAEARLGETWWLGLRQVVAGVDPEEARRTAGFEAPEDPALEAAAKLVGERLLVERDGRFVLTPTGLPLADYVAARFLVPADDA